MNNSVALIESLRSCAQAPPSEVLMNRMLQMAQLFDSSSPCDTRGINIFNFHAETEGVFSAFDMIDVQRDNRLIDYQSMRAHLAWCSRAFCRDARLYLVSGEPPPPCVEATDAVSVQMDVDRSAIMLERVIAMCAYVHSQAFHADTVFLDTDAFPNSELARVFDADFDIGVTYRHDPHVMPLNEGVIFASARNVPAVCRFFLGYLGTFERLIASDRVRDYYGGIGHWRGGQLSLNVLALPARWPLVADATLEGTRLAYFACDEFNYSPDSAMEPEQVAALLPSKRIIHIKGQNKRHFLTAQDHAYRRLAAMTM